MSNDWNSLIEATIWSMHFDPPRHEMRTEFKGPQEGASIKLLHVTGVDDFVATEMRLLNIVDRVVSYSPEDLKRPDGEGARLLFNLMRGRDPLAPDLEWPAYQIKLASVRAGALTLFEMQPVYGASMVVLAERFTLED